MTLKLDNWAHSLNGQSLPHDPNGVQPLGEIAHRLSCVNGCADRLGVFVVVIALQSVLNNRPRPGHVAFKRAARHHPVIGEYDLLSGVVRGGNLDAEIFEHIAGELV